MKSKVKKILIIMFLTTLFILLFGSYGLYSWSVTLDGDMGYFLFYSPLNKLHKSCQNYGLNKFVEESRDTFLTFTTWTPLKEEVEESEVTEPMTPVKEEVEEPPPPLFAGETLDILVIGDSLANSVGKQLGPLINEYPDMTCRIEGVISSNLIRLDYYDWLSEAPRMVDENPVDCVLIFLGANTMQSFYLDGKIASLFSEEWLTIYRERAGLLLDELKKRDLDVYWMALPPMQKEQYNNNITYLNGVIDGVCLSKEVDRFSYTPIITSNLGDYVSEIIVQDRQILLRSDGVHFTREGATYISQYLIEKIRTNYELAPLPEAEEESPNQEIQL